ncbi:hypothetical protein PR202_gb28001 [Eleusine coracana subsp. coracana]|uniref:Uncharacterized protein n=1 Tax=Eleusine coracana subsp. coracana TaxID=191504 RepID=A0AAV5FWR2_ELECO|nr:hypothetical protein PR202_gb28001 [Eleusine coracana subsp. coracana]
MVDQEHQFSRYHYLVLAAILLLPLVVAKLRARRKACKNLPPGPWQLPVIGSLHHLVGALPHRAMRDLARRHGALMLLRLGELPVVVASSPAAAREVMRTHDAAFATRPRTATIRELTRDGTGVAFAPHGERWRAVRKLCVTELLGARRHKERRAAAAGAGSGDEEEDLLDVLLRIQKDGGGGLQVPLDMGTLRAVITDLFGAGSETTATTLQWAMAELIRHPAALRKSQEEVRRVLAGQSRVHEDALPELRYLHMVIKETLRLHAAVPLLLPRECQEDPSCRVLGHDVPKGAMVLVNAWAIGCDAASWGPDAEEFRPERFEGDVVDFRGSDFEFVPFGAGRRMCPGITLGLAVMEMGLASLLFHFDWELPAGATDPSELDMEEALGITARRKSDLWLIPRVRVPPPPNV